MRHLLSLCWYWLLAFKLACDEVLGIRQNPTLVDESRRLHRELFREGKGRDN